MPNNKPGSRLIKAAGGVAWRPGPDGEPEILLVHRKKYDDWSLPKGKTEPGEPLPVTAVREVLEEGGARLALGRRLVSVRYNVGGRPKRVHYWAARVVSVDERAVPNSEVDEVAWAPAARAVERVSYVHDHGVLADFAARPADTVPLILLRHSKAVPKGGWKRSDAARPLDDGGRSDAKALADLLACFAARPRLISSPAVRCADTLRPLAHLTGAPVREEPSLYIHQSNSSRTTAADSGTAITALIREAVASGEPTVICAHRENLPVLQEAALAALAGHPGAEIAAAELPGGAPDDVAGGPIAALPREWDDELPTSGFWVLNVAPLPAPPEPLLELEQPASDAALAAASASPAPDAPPPGRRWWRRLRALPSRGGALGPAADATGAAVAGPAVLSADTAGGDGSAGNAGGGPADGGTDVRGETRAGDAGHGVTARLAGVLISADRYDLSEP
jgi:8-oxo-dGTP pyrophosphatase MutT (NUDIX family)/phosphohistidine phosphatase SixA